VVEKLKAKWREFLQRPMFPVVADSEPSISIEQGIEEYFTDGDGPEVMITFARIRAILIGRKLVRKERSDVGKKRVGKLGPPSDLTPEIASQEVAQAIVAEATNDYRAVLDRIDGLGL
jgi:hypothetical protein